MAFALHCPHCTCGNDDPFEVMARGHVDWMHCSGCARHFYFLIAECKACEEESTFAWQGAPLPSDMKALRCRACGLPVELLDEPTFSDRLGRG